MPKIQVRAEGLADFEGALGKEWIVANGLGGYASSTVLGVNTRKYHGLLVAAFNPPANRIVLLTRIDEVIHLQGKTYSTESIELKGGTRSEGYRFLRGFSLAPFPTYRYDIQGVQIRKTIFMPHGNNATMVRYEVSNPHKTEVPIRIVPLVSFRHFYDVINRDSLNWNFIQKTLERGVFIQPSTSKANLTITLSDGRYVANTGKWVQGIRLRADESRGESCLDDGYQPGHFEFVAGAEGVKGVHLIAAAGRTEKETVDALSPITAGGSKTIDGVYRSELRRRRSLLEGFQRRHPDIRMEEWLKWLVLAADTFIVSRESTRTKSVIAGYHWFEDWGRDSLISLPGLTLLHGRFEEAKEVLLAFKQYCRNGLVPNRFMDRPGEEPIYNAVDATLWYFNAVLQYLKYTGDFNFVKKELWETLGAIVEEHVRGRTPNIHMEDDFLLTHGPRLTWMDVAVNGRAVTPREGKAVEVQGLWYNALKVMEVLSLCFGQGEVAEKYSRLAREAGKSFVEKFWNPERKCLFDVVHGKEVDPSLRPNQVIAASLDFTPLDRTMLKGVVEAVQGKLWGTYGLKTLPEDDPRYVGKYSGGWVQRENAYHNGTVWPWLLGPFTTAFLKANNHEERWRTFAFRTFLQPLFQEGVFQAGLGTLSEIFDGDPPHEPRGCVSQAWSVAEPLRAYVEDVMLRRPPYEHQLFSVLGC